MASIRFKDGFVLFSGGRIAMSEACCCSYTPPSVCVSCPPDYLIGNTASMALGVSGFVGEDPIPFRCNAASSETQYGGLDPDAYDGYTYTQYSRLNSTFLLNKVVGGDCCWENDLLNHGPLLTYSECWSDLEYSGVLGGTYHTGNYHLYRTESRLSKVSVCLYSDGTTVYWHPNFETISIFFMDGVETGTGGVYLDFPCWSTTIDYIVGGYMPIEDFCYPISDTILGKQYKYQVTQSHSFGSYYVYFYTCPEFMGYPAADSEAISNISLTLFPSAVMP